MPHQRPRTSYRRGPIPGPLTRGLSRRRLLAAGGAGAAGLLTTACGNGSGNGGDTDQGNEEWSFTDDRGETITAGSRPQRVVAYVGSAAALYDFGAGAALAGIFGPSSQEDGTPDPLAGELELANLTSLGQAWGEFNLEQYASLQPDLLVTDVWQDDDLWYVPDESEDEILALAPSVGIAVAHTPLTAPIAQYEQLAAALGADLTDPRIAAAKDRFAEASDEVRAAVDANPGLRVLAASASADLLYISDPAVYTDLSYFRELGVALIDPDGVDSGGFFEPLSWENADKYEADLILLDRRTSALQPPDLASNAGWSNLPAVLADQVTPWLSEPRFSYAGCVPLLESLADAIRTTTPLG